jgi:hypothetical protein
MLPQPQYILFKKQHVVVVWHTSKCQGMQVLGHICMQIIAAGLNGYMATVTNLKDSTNKWRCAAVPLAVFSFNLLLLLC